MTATRAIAMTVGVAVGVCLGCTPTAPSAAPPPPAGAPNIVLVTVDALRADTPSFAGGPVGSTPFLDRLAEDSVVFERAISSFVGTTGAMPSLMTGRWPSFEHVSRLAPDNFYGFSDVKSPTEVGQRRLTANVETLAEALTAHGWSTVGFNTNPHLTPEAGFAQGFDLYVQFTGWLGHAKQLRRHRLQGTYPPGHIVATGVERWLDHGVRPPFFAWIHLMDPHSPYLPALPNDRFGFRSRTGLPPLVVNEVLYHLVFSRRGWYRADDYTDLDQAGVTRTELIDHARGLYVGEVLTADTALERIVEALDRHDVLDRTLLVVTADHGEEFGDHGHLFHEVFQPGYEELLRIPLVIRPPGGAGGGLRIASAVRMVDIAPTVLEFAGIEDRISDMDGVSLVPMLRGSIPEDRTAFVSAPRWAVVRTDRWKYRLRKPTGLEELYRIDIDPRERQDLAGTEPEVLAEMRAMWSDFSARLRARATVTDPGAVSTPVIDEDTREQLEALGYTAD